MRTETDAAIVSSHLRAALARDADPALVATLRSLRLRGALYFAASPAARRARRLIRS
jgi:hypothetical protein